MQIQLPEPPRFNIFKLLCDNFQFSRRRYHIGDWISNHNGYLSFRPVISRLDNGRWRVRITVRIGLIDPGKMHSIRLEQEFRSWRTAFYLAESFAYELAYCFYPYSCSLR